MDYVLLFGFLLVFVWFFLRTCYLVALKPFLHDMARYQLFSLRDRLRNIEIASPAQQNIFAVRFLENVLNAAISSVEEISIGAILESKYLRSKQTDEKIKKDLSRFDREASPELRKIDTAFFNTMLLAIRANSPVLCTIFYVSMLFGGKFGTKEDARAVTHSYKPMNGTTNLRLA